MVYIVNSDGSLRGVSNGLIISIFAVTFAVFAAFYVLRSIGLYVLAKRNGVEKPWLGCLPFVWVYTAAKLLESVAVFGKTFKEFALTAFIIITVSSVLLDAFMIIEYFPIIGYYFQSLSGGGEIYFSYYYLRNIPANCNAVFSTNYGYVGLVGFNDPYSAGFRNALNIIYYFIRVLNIVALVFEIIIYSNLFRKFYPNHYFVATVFSIIGFFAPFVFAIRKNNAVNYAEYMRARYASFYGANGGYNNGGYGGGREEPFEEEKGEDKENKNDKDDDPFGEFSDKGDK